MADKSKIEWTDATWNPVVGCTKVSAGCANCYAVRLASGRLSKNPRYAGLAREGKWTGEIRLHPDLLDQLLGWRKPRRIFVCSMSDLFHPDVPDEFIFRVLDRALRGNRRHTYQVLTKRPERMRNWFAEHSHRFWHYHAPDEPKRPYVTPDWPDPCLWLGVSCEDQKTADERIPILLNTPAAVRWVSLEPLLGPVDLSEGGHGWLYVTDLADGRRTHLDWIIVGGESGPGARPMHPDWVRSVRDQCVAAGVPFLFKQWGEFTWDRPDRFKGRWGVLDRDGYYFPETSAWNGRTGDDSDTREIYVYHVGKKAAGRELDGTVWDQYPGEERV